MAPTIAQNPQPKNFEQLADAVRYYSWFHEVVKPWVGRRMLDVGCGYGNVTEHFMGAELVFGADIEREYLDYIRARFAARKNFQADLVDLSQAASIERLKPLRFDTALCFNSLEHIADDVGTARHVYDILEPEGHIIVLVPAFEALMSPYDKAVGHYRRYNKASAEKLLAAAGFKTVDVFYFNALGAFAWLLVYKLLRRDSPGSGSIALLEFLVPCLQKIEAAARPPFGISVIAVGRKDAAAKP